LAGLVIDLPAALAPVSATPTRSDGSSATALGGYQGPVFANGQKTAMSGIATEIVKRSDIAKGFQVLPRRWVVERTFAWLGRCRRLAKDFENLSRNALAFLKLASIRLMMRRLCSN
jgi:transposase